jgi:hypothetical protein
MLLLERGTVAGSPAYFLCERGEITHPYLSRDIAVKTRVYHYPWYLTLVHQHFVILVLRAG